MNKAPRAALAKRLMVRLLIFALILAAIVHFAPGHAPAKGRILRLENAMIIETIRAGKVIDLRISGGMGALRVAISTVNAARSPLLACPDIQDGTAPRTNLMRVSAQDGDASLALWCLASTVRHADERSPGQDAGVIQVSGLVIHGSRIILPMDASEIERIVGDRL